MSIEVGLALAAASGDRYAYNVLYGNQDSSSIERVGYARKRKRSESCLLSKEPT